MINNDSLKKIEHTVNSQPCRFCGLTHRVAMYASQKASQSLAICSSDSVVFPTGDEVRLDFSQDACPEFRSLVAQFVFANSSNVVSIAFDKI